jgi:GTP cyclohydrolase I
MSGESSVPVHLESDPSGFDIQGVEAGARSMLEAAGVDLESDELRDTPRRIAKMLEEMTNPEPVDLTTFPNEGYDELVLARDIPFSSLCAHHLLPFSGVAHVAYVPADRIIGISKLARIVQFFSRSLQVQERLTAQVADCLEEQLAPKGVGVVMVADHACMSLRGAKALGASTVTSAVRGIVRRDERTRGEFFALVEGRR